MELYATPYHGGKEPATTFSMRYGWYWFQFPCTLVYVGATSEICIYHPEVALNKPTWS